MDRKRLVRIFGGPVAVLAFGTASLAVSGMAIGVEATQTPGLAPKSHGEPVILMAQAATPATPATYASDQADRGEDSYEKNCVECHGDDLRGGLLGGPPLRGVSFEEKYLTEAPAGMLFEVMSLTMPPNAPGRYSASTYADIMAYLLKRNGFPAGGAPLPSDVDALNNLTLDK